ncbi:hypothetical protein LJR225_000921 [Phenylobacterium sp. LjRoot225]|uniref:hypothetical protein n=1 Tax=Phenylobacterium sp. LjRoot225 TaxID=3342285 RepID=UPI003ECFBD4C
MTEPARPSVTSQQAISRLLTTVWMAIALGVALQVLVLATRTAAGAPWPGLKWLPDLLNGVTWAVFVCAGVVLGSVAARARSAAMGALGLISAPLGFSAAKGLQRGLQSLMEAPVDKITPAVYALCSVKTVEYACLGAVLGWLLSRPQASARGFALAGLAVGVVFGGVNIWITAHLAKAKFPALAGAVVNELMFPIGCALVIYMATSAARHISILAPGEVGLDDPAGAAGVPLA